VLGQQPSQSTTCRADRRLAGACVLAAAWHGKRRPCRLVRSGESGRQCDRPADQRWTGTGEFRANAGGPLGRAGPWSAARLPAGSRSRAAISMWRRSASLSGSAWGERGEPVARGRLPSVTVIAGHRRTGSAALPGSAGLRWEARHVERARRSWVPSRILAVAVLTALLAVAVIAASAESRWPGPLDHIRRHPWLWVPVLVIAIAAFEVLRFSAITLSKKAGGTGRERWPRRTPGQRPGRSGR
jgi:hypothetical protein